MEENKKETVVVHEHDDRVRNPLGWVIAVIVIILLLLAFFLYGGFGLFGGGSGTGGTDVNVQAPESINVQPTTGQ